MTAGKDLHRLLHRALIGVSSSRLHFCPPIEPSPCQPSNQGGIGMEPKGFHRKLTAILSADVAGYSRLMQDDEGKTVTTLESYKQAFFDLIKQHRGRVVDSPGDNLLAEFGSVVDAVQCAVAVQKEFDLRNAQLPENRRMWFRIGVNLGDVIEEGNRIYGDGVNIAARLEALAQPGGICISKTAFDHIESKLPFGYEFLGEQTVKNIAKPVGAYRVVLEPRVTKKRASVFKPLGTGRRMTAIGLAAALVVVAGVALWQYLRLATLPPALSLERADPKQMALPLPELPSIAVLPFVNLSEDPKQQLLCDGITDNIIGALSKVPRLFVIARNSTFTYKGKVVKAKQVSEELGVRYVLEGSIQRSSDRVRILVQLVDALKGAQLMAERYDAQASELFDLQDDITLKVLTAVQIKLTGTSPTGMKSFKGTHGLDCMLKLQEGFGYLNRNNLTETRKAHQIAEETIDMCPEIPNSYRLLAAVYTNYYWFDASKPPGESIEKAKELLQKTLSMDDSYALAHGNLSILYLQQRDYDKAISEGERAVNLDQGSPFTVFMYAKALLYSGRPKEAIPLLEKAIRLNPLAPSPFYNDLGLAFRLTGRLEEAAALYQKSLQRAPNDFWMHAALTGVYIEMGREEEARAAAAEVMRINPKFSLEWYGKRALLKDRSIVNANIDSLRKAGLPDKPPAAQP
jgi:adenylate cyclase